MLANLRELYRSARAPEFVFVHINKTGGSSIEKALRLPFQHKTALELRDEIGLSAWRKAFTFAVVRNPWEKVASHYFYRVQTNQTDLGSNPIPFNDWVKRAYGDFDPVLRDKERMFMPQVNWLVDQNQEVIVEFIARFERLESDFAYICQRLNRHASLPHLKRSNRPDYRSLFTEDTAQIVADRFAPDLKAFGYEF